MHSPLAVLILLLAAWLGGTAWAQPAAPESSPAFVDSRQECSLLGGAWVARNPWQSACQVPWQREECLRLGGGWTPLVGAPAGGICIAQVSQIAVGRQCADAGGEWGPAGSSMPYCQPAAGRQAIVRAAPDANKPCDSQSDCSYGCVYQGPPVSTGADVLGRCRANNARSGCHAMVEKGRLAGRICLD